MNNEVVVLHVLMTTRLDADLGARLKLVKDDLLVLPVRAVAALVFHADSLDAEPVGHLVRVSAPLHAEVLLVSEASTVGVANRIAVHLACLPLMMCVDALPEVRVRIALLCEASTCLGLQILPSLCWASCALGAIIAELCLRLQP